MAERVVTGYTRLFEVRLLHHYWLDDGHTIYDAISDTAKKSKRLLTYDVRPFLSVTPTEKTAQLLKGLRCVFKDTALGLVVAAPAAISMPDDAIFDFVVRVQNDQFFNYSALTLRKQKVYEIYHQSEDKMYRFKENIPVFSNETGASRGVAPDITLFLSKEYQPVNSADTAESLILSGTDLEQLTSDQPIASPNQILGTATDWPVFFHQNDAPFIVPPAGLAGVPLRGIELTGDLTDDIFALIRIRTLLPSNNFSLLKENAPPTLPPLLRSPVFDIRFKNRATFWRYYDKTDGDFKLFASAGQPFPYTFNGNPISVGTMRKKASPASLAIEMDSSGLLIDQLYSDIIE
jgi:hypothetical protein